ncbi:MAG: hypothetical protein JO166_06035 [Deltaproteobacteria bacterium]|nr:hypothetical protein [Deltaproteobacteria bacterium]
MARGIQMHQHADHRAALAPTPILAARRFFLDHSGLLQHQPQPVVRNLHAVSFSDLFVKVPQRKIRIDVTLEPAQQLDGAGLYPLAARSAAALVHDCIQAVMLHSPANPPYLAWFDPDNLGRLYPRELSRDGFDDHFPPGHCPRLTPHPPRAVLHRAPLPQSAVMFKCL